MATGYNPASRIVKTAWLVQRELEKIMGLNPAYDTNATLNAKYNIDASRLPDASSPPILRYFGIGVRGNRNVDDGNAQRPNEVASTNMDLYTPLPFRAVPLDQDLSSSERAQYRLRVLETINGETYALYYLKLLENLSTGVVMTRRNVLTGVEEPYVPDYSQLTPEPPEAPLTGVVDGSVDDINVTVTTEATIKGSEVIEAINVLYDGQMHLAKVSEIGIYMGSDYQRTAQDATGTNFNYTESCMTQLGVHYCYNGTDLSNPTSTHNFLFRVGKSDVILI